MSVIHSFVYLFIGSICSVLFTRCQEWGSSQGSWLWVLQAALAGLGEYMPRRWLEHRLSWQLKEAAFVWCFLCGQMSKLVSPETVLVNPHSKLLGPILIIINTLGLSWGNRGSEWLSEGSGTADTWLLALHWGVVGKSSHGAEGGQGWPHPKICHLVLFLHHLLSVDTCLHLLLPDPFWSSATWPFVICGIPKSLLLSWVLWPVLSSSPNFHLIAEPEGEPSRPVQPPGLPFSLPDILGKQAICQQSGHVGVWACVCGTTLSTSYSPCAICLTQTSGKVSPRATRCLLTRDELEQVPLVLSSGLGRQHGTWGVTCSQHCTTGHTPVTRYVPCARNMGWPSEIVLNSRFPAECLEKWKTVQETEQPPDDGHVSYKQTACHPESSAPLSPDTQAVRDSLALVMPPGSPQWGPVALWQIK